MNLRLRSSLFLFLPPFVRHSSFLHSFFQRCHLHSRPFLRRINSLSSIIYFPSFNEPLRFHNKHTPFSSLFLLPPFSYLFYLFTFLLIFFPRIFPATSVIYFLIFCHQVAEFAIINAAERRKVIGQDSPTCITLLLSHFSPSRDFESMLLSLSWGQGTLPPFVSVDETFKPHAALWARSLFTFWHQR